jgi:hypothetical protein
MRISKKTIIILLAAVILAVLGWVIFQGKNQAPSAPQEQSQQPAKNQISVSLAVGEKTYQTKIDEGSNVYELMQKLANETDLKFVAKEFSGLGYYIEEINGVASDPQANKYWMFSINGVPSNTGISQTILKEGDAVEWKM